MDADAFSEKVNEWNERLSSLETQAASASPQRETLLEIAFSELSTSVEELRVAQEELRTQNEQLAASQAVVEDWRHHYEDLFESAPDAYLVTDLSGVIQEANRAAAQLLGISQRFINGKALISFVPESERRAFREGLVSLPERRFVPEWETLLQPRRSAPFEAALTVALVLDRQGQPAGLRWLVRDISQRYQSEAERYRLLVAEIQDYAILLMTPDGEILHWNAGARNIFGYTEDEARGQHSAMLFTPEETATGVPEQEIRQAVSEGRAQDERWHVRKDGSRFWASGVMTALRDKRGHLHWLAKVLRDETARHQERERLTRRYEQVRNIAETFQRALLPEIPPDAFPGLCVAPFYEAAWSEAQVGGDFYDAFALETGEVVLVVGDVSGKGLGAATRTAEIKAVLRAFLREDPDAARVLARLNNFLYDCYSLDERRTHAFATLSLALVRPHSGETTVTVAGAEPPLVMRDGDRAEIVPVRGGLLGVERGQSYVTVAATLDLGDTLLMTTDGITEARRGTEYLEYNGFVALATQSLPLHSLEQRGQSILAGVHDFIGGPLQDDVSLLLARREQGGARK